MQPDMVFKKCINCGKTWPDRDSFLDDPEIFLIGYQANFKYLKLGGLLFNHSCRTTLALPADLFIDLYDGPVFSERVTGSDACPGYCLSKTSLSPCSAQCECAFIREILQIIKYRHDSTIH
ncbi:MAG: hypothetical protein A2277_03910 [Desulfobacterales bacterium RIFOXYA12_FULL_46_15]|nr:MAG: hypothetical protein A2097_03715 [Desulfobacula sp. GWF2_41_7]OGR22631.1 MAG: hypothetical protein A2277_03910 [Desulfobacterales bacterium RIFOXYA12_FULL_46_15]